MSWGEIKNYQALYDKDRYMTKTTTNVLVGTSYLNLASGYDRVDWDMSGTYGWYTYQLKNYNYPVVVTPNAEFNKVDIQLGYTLSNIALSSSNTFFYYLSDTSSFSFAERVAQAQITSTTGSFLSKTMEQYGTGLQQNKTYALYMQYTQGQPSGSVNKLTATFRNINSSTDYHESTQLYPVGKPKTTMINSSGSFNFQSNFGFLPRVDKIKCTVPYYVSAFETNDGEKYIETIQLAQQGAVWVTY